jgi:VCBS repeat-containing protein
MFPCLHWSRFTAFARWGVALTLLAAAGSATAATSTWVPGPTLTTSRYAHTATLLPSGKVLIAAGDTSTGGPATALSDCVLYDPATNAFVTTGSLTTPRFVHTATLLPSGKVLVAGGSDHMNLHASCEVFDPAAGTWSATGPLAVGRWAHTASLLSTGQVLVVGGQGLAGNLASCELYDPATGTWSATGNLGAARSGHSAITLASGRVLVVSGGDAGGPLASCEIYDPLAGTWSFTGPLSTARWSTATLLPGGSVLVAGGSDAAGNGLVSCELYDPLAGTWSPAPAMTSTHGGAPASVIGADVLIAGGGYPDSTLVETFIGTSWITNDSLNAPRLQHTATPLPRGHLLLIGGTYGNVAIATTEIRDAAPPVAAADSYSVSDNSTLTVASAQGVLANDGDGDGDPLTASVVATAAHGSLALAADGSFVYTPVAGFHGTDGFTYAASDGFVAAQATVTITVKAPPVTVADTYTTAEDTDLTVAAPGVLGNDSDPDGDPLTASLLAAPTHGTVAVAADGSFTYHPAADYHGSDSFTYTATDGVQSTTGSVSLTVTSVDDAPQASPVSCATVAGRSVQVALSASDVEGDALTYAVASTPAHGTATIAGGIATYTPASGFSGTDTFTFRASDGTLTSNAAAATIVVAAYAPETGGQGSGATETFCGMGSGTAVLIAALGLLRRRSGR